ncbi:hypothetical protein KEG38_24645 [Polyangium jinanense]|nr:hypothetical protein [Polyangium jinanense]
MHVLYKASDTNATNAEIKPHFNIVNGSDVSVPLAELQIRYYYTLETNGSQTEVFHCDYALVGCGKVSGAFMTTSGANADHYLEVTFSGADVLTPGQQSGEIQARYNKMDYASYDETNDYSFDPTKTAFADWDKVTLYHNGALVWGVEP